MGVQGVVAESQARSVGDQCALFEAEAELHRVLGLIDGAVAALAKKDAKKRDVLLHPGDVVTPVGAPIANTNM